MNVSCGHCNAKLNIPDEKIAKNRENIFKCPKCREKIIVPPQGEKPSVMASPPSLQNLSFEERKNALVCTRNRELRDQLLPVIKQMGFGCEVPMNAKDAVERMDYHIYHLVMVDESFDPEGDAGVLFLRMNAMDMSLRRKICFIMVTEKFNSNDNMAALHASVNNMIHFDDIPHLSSFLTKALIAHQNLYKVYNDCLREAGRA